MRFNRKPHRSRRCGRLCRSGIFIPVFLSPCVEPTDSAVQRRNLYSLQRIKSIFPPFSSLLFVLLDGELHGKPTAVHFNRRKVTEYLRDIRVLFRIFL